MQDSTNPAERDTIQTQGDWEQQMMPRSARLWEDTIVLALRDAQWLRCQEHWKEENKPSPRPITPPGMIKLDGRAESRLGDVAMSADERFFLIEVKSGPEQIKDEWCKAGRFNPKMVYTTLSKASHRHNDSNVMADDSGVASFLRWSFLGHFIALWDNHPSGVTGQERSILVLPYLQAVRDSVANSSIRDPEMIKAFHPKMIQAVRPDSDGRAAQATVLDLGRKDCVLTWLDEDGARKFDNRNIGLNFSEFQTYVAILCKMARTTQDSEGEPINAVVLSSSGSFFQYVGDTTDLARLLSKNDVEHAHARGYQRPGASRGRPKTQDEEESHENER